jgi:hypothetical protein
MGATTTNGSFWMKAGGCERYRKWTRGRESSDGTGLEPAADLRGESNGRHSESTRTFVSD